MHDLYKVSDPDFCGCLLSDWIMIWKNIWLKSKQKKTLYVVIIPKKEVRELIKKKKLRKSRMVCQHFKWFASN